MAQTGYTPISIYYSSTAAAIPTAGNLVAGELAINTADGKLFYKDSSGVVQVIGTKGGVGSSTTTQVLYNSSGLVVGSANMTFNGTTLTLANDASISGLKIGKGAGSDADSTALGALAINANTTGTQNSGAGWASLFANTTGSSNSGFGYGTLFTNTTGGSNTAIGASALYSNTTASNNTAVGYQAGYATTTGRITAFGHRVLYSNTTGAGNTGIGGNDGSVGSALLSNTTGNYNIAVGTGSLQNNTTASNNTAVGYQAGYSNTTGNNSVMLGRLAGYSATISAQNTFIGANAGYSSNVTAGGNGYNTFVGYAAGYSSTTGYNNTFVGSNGNGTGAGHYVTTGIANTILGAYNGNQGGLDIRTSSNYIVLSDGDGNPRAYFDTVYGANYVGNSATAVVSRYFGTNLTNQVGLLAFGASNNEASAGDGILKVFANATYASPKMFVVSNSGGVYLATGATSWTANSDSRLKNITGTYTNALADIAQIQPVKFTWKFDETAKPQVGVIAQSVQAVVPEAIEQSKAIKGDDTEYLGVRYTELIPLMIASIQELKAEIDTLKGVK